MPQFFDHTAFPEPTIVEVEAPVIDPVAKALSDDAPVATGTPHAMTAAEQQALERELQQLEEQRGERLRSVKSFRPKRSSGRNRNQMTDISDAPTSANR